MLTTQQTANTGAPVINLFEQRPRTIGADNPFARAAKLWRKAVWGNAAAQYILGLAHMKGNGFPENHDEGVKWLRKAAAQGHVGGQVNLGVAYALGRGVARNTVMAHLWFDLAAAAGRQRAIEYRIRIARFMSHDEIAEAKQLMRDWRPVIEDPLGF